MLLLTEKLQQASDFGVSLTISQIETLKKYIMLLDKWNQAYNLTAVRNPLDMVNRHIIDSLVIAPYITGNTILDVGTGAGLPGIPLAVLYPDRKIFLLDSNGKKTRFLFQVKTDLILNNVNIIQSRVENYKDHQFDCVVSRAYASPQVFLETAGHLCAGTGQILVMTTNQEDIGNIENKQVKLEGDITLAVPGGENRRLVILKKQGS